MYNKSMNEKRLKELMEKAKTVGLSKEERLEILQSTNKVVSDLRSVIKTYARK